MMGDLLVVAGFVTVGALALVVTGVICDPGGLYDRVMCWWEDFTDPDTVHPDEWSIRDPRDGEGR
jgi:hypothetical protein